MGVFPGQGRLVVDAVLSPLIHTFFNDFRYTVSVSKRSNLPLVRALVLGVVVAAGSTPLAYALSGDVSLDEVLTPSAAPALLGPISESGRNSWACKPEQTAASSRVNASELPDTTRDP